MAQFDVHRDPVGPGYLIDCQADMLADLTTRLAVPLQPPAVAPQPAGRLNPSFKVGDDQLVMVTQFAAAVPVSELGPPVLSLRDRRSDIVGAIDILLTGV